MFLGMIIACGLEFKGEVFINSNKHYAYFI